VEGTTTELGRASVTVQEWSTCGGYGRRSGEPLLLTEDLSLSEIGQGSRTESRNSTKGGPDLPPFVTPQPSSLTLGCLGQAVMGVNNSIGITSPIALRVRFSFVLSPPDFHHT
jgi:hypothetical protein